MEDLLNDEDSWLGKQLIRKLCKYYESYSIRKLRLEQLNNSKKRLAPFYIINPK